MWCVNVWMRGRIFFFEVVFCCCFSLVRLWSGCCGSWKVMKREECGSGLVRVNSGSGKGWAWKRGQSDHHQIMRGLVKMVQKWSLSETCSITVQFQFLRSSIEFQLYPESRKIIRYCISLKTKVLQRQWSSSPRSEEKILLADVLTLKQMIASRPMFSSKNIN